MKINRIQCLLFLLFVFQIETISAQISVAKIFSDNMVLQQNAEVSIWGWANPGDSVLVSGSWNGISVKTITTNNSKWIATLETPAAKTDGTAYSVTISGSNTITLSNVLIGEVWLLSGQSNMEMQLQGWEGSPIEGSAQAISSANFPNIRLLTVNKNTTAEPQKDIVNNSATLWKECSPSTARYFSAVGFFFGRELYSTLNIPIGLVNSSWGGSSCETWANEKSLDFVSDYANGGPWKPKDNNDNQTATVLYNGMIAPLVPFNFAGVCWYQGETNVGRSEQLTQLFPAMIEGWRDDFKKENLPFYFVQLAPWGGYGEGVLPVFWEAQANTLKLHDTEMAETLDAGDAENIHPAKKEPIGFRLAQKALANVYGQTELVSAGPRYDSLSIEGNKIRLYFTHTGSGLKAATGALQQFEIAGSNNIFYPANAVIDGAEILVSGTQVGSPKNVRYAWNNNATASLYNNENFPAPPFRTNPPAYIKSLNSTFLIGSELINERESVKLKWTTLGAKQVLLNGKQVTSTSTLEVFPDSTTTFTLAAINKTDTLTTEQTVYVIPKELSSQAKGKITNASSSRTGYGSKLAVDEKNNTYWSSNYSNDQWISIDFGESIPVKLVILQWSTDFGKAYEIQVSDDFTNWQTIFTETNGNGGIDFIPDLSGNGKYVRIKGLARSGSRAYDLAEFAVYSNKSRQTGSLKDKNDNIMRGTPMVLGSNLPVSVEFALNPKNWETIKNNGFNTIRVCWVDPWYKTHDKNSWSVSEVLPWFDKCVENAVSTGMNIIINFHNVGAQQEFDTGYTFESEKEFWDSIAPRYRENDLVYYEIANEPTFTMTDYLKPAFKENLLKIYNSIRSTAPERQILLFSFNTIKNEIIQVVEDYRNKIDWDFTSVAYHMYNSETSESIQTLMAYHRVICTEWNYDFESNRDGFNYIKQVDGYKENSETLEKLGSSWIDWRDWEDTTLNELLDTLISDARLKNYWWGVPVSGTKVSAVHLVNYKVELKSGKSIQLLAYILPALAENQEIKWQSSNPESVSVSGSGLITALATQSKTAIITATSANGNYAAQCEVVVIPPEKKGAYPNGIPHKIPGTINSTFYDLGGEGVGYHDLNAANNGDGIRQEQGVETEFRLAEGSVGGIQSGEWLEFTINVEEESLYNIEILFATPGRYGIFHIEFDEADKTGETYVRPTSGYNDFRPTTIENILLKKGAQIMRIFFDDASYNMGTISINKSDATGISEFEKANAVKVYPNPVKDRIRIFPKHSLENYSIKNITGQTVLKGLVKEDGVIDLSALLSGNYFLSIHGKDFIKVEKIVKL